MIHTKQSEHIVDSNKLQKAHTGADDIEHSVNNKWFLLIFNKNLNKTYVCSADDNGWHTDDELYIHIYTEKATKQQCRMHHCGILL